MGQCFMECGEIMEVKLPQVCAHRRRDERWLVSRRGRTSQVYLSFVPFSPRFSRVLYLASFCRVLRAAQRRFLQPARFTMRHHSGFLQTSCRVSKRPCVYRMREYFTYAPLYNKQRAQTVSRCLRLPTHQVNPFALFSSITCDYFRQVINKWRKNCLSFFVFFFYCNLKAFSYKSSKLYII